MQTLTRSINRSNSVIVQPIDIRKTALLNSFHNSNGGNSSGSNDTSNAMMIASSSSSSSGIASTSTSTAAADALSPNVTPAINPFDESFNKTIQAQYSTSSSSSISSTNVITPPPVTPPTQTQTVQRSTSSYINRATPATTTIVTPSLQQHSKSLVVSTTTTNNIISVNSSINLKQTHKIGKYILFDVLTTSASQQQQQATSSSSQSDLMFNIALNLVDKQSYYWRKIPANEYMKKLQAYYLMDSSEYVYRFHELIVDAKDAYLFFQPHHGDLHSYMKEKKRLRESEAKSLFYQIVQVVRQCHENGIIVRDIKLKKFVFSDAEKTKIALTNLEDCLVLDDMDNDLIKSQQGCPAYVSPEVLNPSQTHYSGKLSDSWSLGIVLYTLLFGRYPFHHNTITTMFAKIAKGKFQIPTNGISLDAKILLRSLIRLNATERLLPDEIVKNNWFKDFSLEDYKNIYEINKLIHDSKATAVAAASSRTINNNQEQHAVTSLNYFQRQYLMETNSVLLAKPSSSLNRNDEQSVPSC